MHRHGHPLASFCQHLDQVTAVFWLEYRLEHLKMALQPLTPLPISNTRNHKIQKGGKLLFLRTPEESLIQEVARSCSTQNCGLVFHSGPEFSRLRPASSLTVGAFRKLDRGRESNCLRRPGTHQKVS